MNSCVAIIYGGNMERVGTLNVTNGIFTSYTMSGIKYTTGLHHAQLFSLMALTCTEVLISIF